MTAWEVCTTASDSPCYQSLGIERLGGRRPGRTASDTTRLVASFLNAHSGSRTTFTLVVTPYDARVSEEIRPSEDTVAFLFDLAKDSPAQAVDQIKSLQSRVGQAFTAGTVVIGFTSVATIAGSHLTHATLGALAMTGLNYVLLMAVALWLLRPTYVFGLPNPQKLWDDYLSHAAASIQLAFLERLALDWPDNDRRVRSAERAARWAVAFVTAEVASMAVALLLSRFNT